MSIGLTVKTEYPLSNLSMFKVECPISTYITFVFMKVNSQILSVCLLEIVYSNWPTIQLCVYEVKPFLDFK